MTQSGKQNLRHYSGRHDTTTCVPLLEKSATNQPESQILTKIATDGLASIQQAAFPLAAALIILGTVGIAASFLIQTQKPAEKTKTE